MPDHRICRCDCGEPTPYDDWRCDECREREDDQDRPKLPSADDVWEVAKTMPASATWADALREWKRRNNHDEPKSNMVVLDEQHPIPTSEQRNALYEHVKRYGIDGRRNRVITEHDAGDETDG